MHRVRGVAAEPPSHLPVPVPQLVTPSDHASPAARRDDAVPSERPQHAFSLPLTQPFDRLCGHAYTAGALGTAQWRLPLISHVRRPFSLASSVKPPGGVRSCRRSATALKEIIARLRETEVLVAYAGRYSPVSVQERVTGDGDVSVRRNWTLRRPSSPAADAEPTSLRRRSSSDARSDSGRDRAEATFAEKAEDFLATLNEVRPHGSPGQRIPPSLLT